MTTPPPSASSQSPHPTDRYGQNTSLATQYCVKLLLYNNCSIDLYELLLHSGTVWWGGCVWLIYSFHVEKSLTNVNCNYYFLV